MKHAPLFASLLLPLPLFAQEAPKTEGKQARRSLPAVGAEAPPFRLRTPEGKEVSLADYRGKKPVVLVFGSYT